MSFNISRRHFMAATAGTAAGLASGVSFAQEKWPVKPLKFLVGFPPGGQTDLFARAYGDYITRETGQPVIVENKPGAGGAIAAQELKRSPADGYTSMWCVTSTLTLNPFYNKDAGYDVVKDFSIISAMPAGSAPFVVNSKLGVNNLKEFIELVRKTDKPTLGTYGAGTFGHMLVDQLNRQFNVKITPVHYKGEAPMWIEVGSGQVMGGVGSYSGVLPVLQSGTGRAIAITNARISKLPDLQTFREQGTTSKAFDLLTFQACSVPIGTPVAVQKRLGGLLVAGGKTEAVQKLIATYGIDQAAMNLEASQKLFADELPVWLESAKVLEVPT